MVAAAVRTTSCEIPNIRSSGPALHVDLLDALVGDRRGPLHDHAALQLERPRRRAPTCGDARRPDRTARRRRWPGRSRAATGHTSAGDRQHDHQQRRARRRRLRPRQRPERAGAWVGEVRGVVGRGRVHPSTLWARASAVSAPAGGASGCAGCRRRGTPSPSADEAVALVDVGEVRLGVEHHRPRSRRRGRRRAAGRPSRAHPRWPGCGDDAADPERAVGLGAGRGRYDAIVPSSPSIQRCWVVGLEVAPVGVEVRRSPARRRTPRPGAAGRA